MWELDPDAVILEPEEHASATSGKYLVMLLLRGDKLVDNKRKSNLPSVDQNPGSQQFDYSVAGECLMQFARLRQSFQHEERMTFAVADVRSLDPGLAWQRLYVTAVKSIGCTCPVLVWHPKRHKYHVLNCRLTERTKHLLEQTLDGNITSWTEQRWPT